MSKIIICGLNGSGKTTLGKVLAEKINYVHKDIEDYFFNNTQDYKYAYSLSKDKVIKLLENDFKKYSNIIFTACKGDYGSISENYDFAIYIKLDKNKRLERVKNRSFELFKERILEGGDLYYREQRFWNYVYSRDEKEILKWFESLTCRKIVIDGNNSLSENTELVMQIINDFIDICKEDYK